MTTTNKNAPRIDKTHKTDKTRRLILDAFASLLVERGYECLTIKDILDRAAIGRTTFYDHFRSKEELLRHSVGRMGEAMAGKAKADEATPLGFTLAFFQHVGSEHGLYNTIVGREDFAIVERYVRRMLIELVLDELRSMDQDVLPPILEAAAQHVVGGLLSLVSWWKENRGLFTPEQINGIFQQLTLPGLAAILSSR
jgi:AcrR family transcriptional regulator